MAGVGPHEGIEHEEQIGRLRPSEMNDHYNVPEGKEKIAKRKFVYEVCLPPGMEFIDFDTEIIRTFEAITNNDKYGFQKNWLTVVDVGCSYPDFLKLWSETDYKGRFIGIEPNTEQFNGLPYWRPVAPNTPISNKGWVEYMETIKGVFVREEEGKTTPPGIELYKSKGDSLPLLDNSTHVITFNFSFYHIPNEEQELAISEAKRVLLKIDSEENTHEGLISNSDSVEYVAGIFVLTTSGNDNKEKAREDEIKIADLLSDRLGATVYPPEPLSSGFTSEDAERLLPNKFRYVYEQKVERPIVVYGELTKAVYMEAHESIMDNYRCAKTGDEQLDADLEEQKNALFNEVLKEIVEDRIDRKIEENDYFEDSMHRSIFFASDRPLENIEAMGFVRVNPAS